MVIVRVRTPALRTDHPQALKCQICGSHRFIPVVLSSVTKPFIRVMYLICSPACHTFYISYRTYLHYNFNFSLTITFPTSIIHLLMNHAELFIRLAFSLWRSISHSRWRDRREWQLGPSVFTPCCFILDIVRYCKKSNRFELWKILYNYTDSRSTHGYFLPDVIIKNSPFVKINTSADRDSNFCAVWVMFSSCIPYFLFPLCHGIPW